MLKRCKSLADIKSALNIIFKPDITVKWDGKDQCYYMNAVSQVGQLALTKFKPIFKHNDKGFVVFDMDQAQEYIGHFGLTTEVTEKEES